MASLLIEDGVVCAVVAFEAAKLQVYPRDSNRRMPVRKDVYLGLEMCLGFPLQDSPKAITIPGPLSLGSEEW
jgi:hypothetical protein